MRGFIAPWVLDGAINRDAFETYVDKVLVPELRPGDIVIMDDLGSHKGPKARAMIEATGAELLYLPPYSPDFNPIEMAFSKLKALLRKAAERSVSSLWTAIGCLIDLFTPAECRNFFKVAGYDAILSDDAMDIFCNYGILLSSTDPLQFETYGDDEEGKAILRSGYHLAFVLKIGGFFHACVHEAQCRVGFPGRSEITFRNFALETVCETGGGLLEFISGVRTKW